MPIYDTTPLAFTAWLVPKRVLASYFIISALVLAVGGNLIAQTDDTQYSNNYEANYGDYTITGGNETQAYGNYDPDYDYSNAAYDSSSTDNADNYESNVAADGINIAASASSPATKEDSGFPHPAAANHWRTQELLFTNRLPSSQQIDACREELLALGLKAINAEMMLTSRNIVNRAVVSAPKVYHWCFYYSTWRLENELSDMAINRSFQEKFAFFIGKMKELWILARALDAALSTTKYFGYIRYRYIEMAANHFGRRVQPVSPPLGDHGQAAFELLNRPMNRPAAPAFSDY